MTSASDSAVATTRGPWPVCRHAVLGGRTGSAAGQARQPRRGKLAPRTRSDPQLPVGGSRILIIAPPPASGYRSYPLADQPEANTTSSAISPCSRNRPQRHHTGGALDRALPAHPQPDLRLRQTSCERATTVEHNSPPECSLGLARMPSEPIAPPAQIDIACHAVARSPPSVTRRQCAAQASQVSDQAIPAGEPPW
jgi:hypothetical protein